MAKHGKITSKQAQALALRAQNKTLDEIAQIMGNSASNVWNLLNNAHLALKESGIESPVELGVRGVTKLIERSVEVYDRAIEDYGKSEGSSSRAVDVSTHVLKGTKVLVDKTIIDKREAKLTLELKGNLARAEIERFSEFGFNVGEVSEGAEAQEVSETPVPTHPPGDESWVW